MHWLPHDHGKKQSWGRCWVASKFEAQLRALGMSPAHHPVPSEDPHPTGFLTFADALGAKLQSVS